MRFLYQWYMMTMMTLNRYWVANLLLASALGFALGYIFGIHDAR